MANLVTSASYTRMAMAMLGALAVVLLPSCGAVYSPPVYEPPPGYAEVYEACEVVARDAPSNYSDGRFWIAVPAECGSILGDAFGLDWASFGLEPRDFHEAGAAADLVIGGLLMVIADNNVDLEETVGAGAPPMLADELARVSSELGLDDATDAGELWFGFMQGAIWRIEYEPSLGHAMAYSRADGLVLVGDIKDAIEPEGFSEEGGIWIQNPLEVLEVAGLLVHEASHAIYHGHVECTGDSLASSSCDATNDGAYGAGAWWTHLWLLDNLDGMDPSTCIEAAFAADDWCEHINEVGDWPACELREECWEL